MARPRPIRIHGGQWPRPRETGCVAEFALVLARLLGRNGNRVGAILYDTGTTRIVPPGTGRSHALRIGRELDRGPDSRAAATTDLAAMLDTVASLARRCLVVVISDFIGTGEWQRPLLRLAHRNEVVALRIVDGADDALPEAGLIVVEDAETGEQILLDSADPWFRTRFRDGVDEREADFGPACAGQGCRCIASTRAVISSRCCSKSSPRPGGGVDEPVLRRCSSLACWSPLR